MDEVDGSLQRAAAGEEQGPEPAGSSGSIPRDAEDPDAGEPDRADADAPEQAAEGAEPDLDAPLVSGAAAPLAVLEGVTKEYGGHPALGPIDLRLEGTCVGLLGPNGAGKTTLLRILMGVLPPSAGRAEVLGQDATAAQQRIGYAPEGEARFPGLTGVASVAYAGRLLGMPRADALQRAHQVLDYVELGEARYRPASTYSTGMRQRLKLAQALVHDPELLILDEPTEGVDPEARRDLLDLIAELREEHGLRIILSTHLLHDVERLASHVVVLSRGQIAAHGALDELKSAAAEGYAVRVDGDVALLASRLDAEGVHYEQVGGTFRVRDEPHAILEHAAAAGLTVRHLAPLELSLHEAFEQAVGGTHA